MFGSHVDLARIAGSFGIAGRVIPRPACVPVEQEAVLLSVAVVGFTSLPVGGSC